MKIKIIIEQKLKQGFSTMQRIGGNQNESV